MKKMILVVAVAFAAMSCGSKCDKKCCQEAEAAQQEQAAPEEEQAAPEEEQEELTPEEQEILKALQEAFEQAGLTE